MILDVASVRHDLRYDSDEMRWMLSQLTIGLRGPLGPSGIALNIILLLTASVHHAVKQSLYSKKYIFSKGWSMLVVKSLAWDKVRHFPV